MQEATQGVMQGFFVRGSTMTLSDQADPNITLQVHLHKCQSQSEPFFHKVWDVVWTLVAKMSANGEEYGLEVVKEGSERRAIHPLIVTSELAEAMMLLPSALKACGINDHMQKLLGEAIKTLNSTRIAFDFPGAKHTPQEVRERMAYAAYYWTRYDFKHFGIQLGALLRDAVMVSFPEKYSIDATGLLQRNSDIAASQPGWTWLAVPGFVVGSLLGAFVGMRAVRSLRNAHSSSSAFLDIEACSDQEVIVE